MFSPKPGGPALKIVLHAGAKSEVKCAPRKTVSYILPRIVRKIKRKRRKNEEKYVFF